MNDYLANIDAEAKAHFFRLVKELDKKKGITEKLKAENQMEWVARMNNIREQNFEVVNGEIIYI